MNLLRFVPKEIGILTVFALELIVLYFATPRLDVAGIGRGVEIRTLNTQLVNKLAVKNLAAIVPQKSAVIVTRVVEDSSENAASGIEENDIIVSLNGKECSDALSFSRELKKRRVGSKVKLGLIRGGERLERDITLAKIGSHSTFLDSDNLLRVARAFSWIAIMAVGQCIVIISGGIDLAVGSVLGLSVVVTAFCMTTQSLSVPVSIAMGLLSGLGCGFANGLMVAKGKLSPFIATLGMLSIARGVAFYTTKGRTITLPDSITHIFSRDNVWSVSVPIGVMLATALVGSIFLSHLRWGRYVYAIGGNEEAARLSGIRVDRIKILIYSIAGLLCGLAGVVYVFRFGTASSRAGFGYELDVIAATVIGGASLSGGKGTVMGAVVGAGIMGVLRNGLTLMGVGEELVLPAIGSVIILAVLLDQNRMAIQSFLRKIQ